MFVGISRITCNCGEPMQPDNRGDWSCYNPVCPDRGRMLRVAYVQFEEREPQKGAQA